ncbi:MAG: hypothetical protein AB7U20_04215 [Planctomycetaceae bacterium]
MWENMKFKAEKNYGSILAVYFVLSVGMVCITTAVLLMFPANPNVAWAVLGVLGTAILVSLVARRRDLPTHSLLGIFGSRRRELCDDYVPERRRPRSLNYGTNLPPTVEDLREAADSANNWVPSGPISGRRAVRKR